MTPNPVPGTRCGGCAAPLTPAPAPEQVPGELLGRRRGARVTRDLDARLRLPGAAAPIVAVLRDVSVTGLSLACLPALDVGAVVRVTTATFDALARVVACRPSGPAHMAHARLLTLQLTKQARADGGPTGAAA